MVHIVCSGCRKILEVSTEGLIPGGIVVGDLKHVVGDTNCGSFVLILESSNQPCHYCRLATKDVQEFDKRKIEWRTWLKWDNRTKQYVWTCQGCHLAQVRI